LSILLSICILLDPDATKKSVKVRFKSFFVKVNNYLLQFVL